MEANIGKARYANLFPDYSTEQKPTLPKLVGGHLRDNRITQFIFSGLITTTAARIAESHGIPSPQIPASEEVVVLLDNLVKWSGSKIEYPLDLLSFLNALGSAAVYVGVPAKIWELILAAQGKLIAEKVRRQSEAMRVRGEKEQAIREGRANLDGKVGANVQIDVGKSDPSIAELVDSFHSVDISVVSYWDRENTLFEANPAWQRTNDDWTNKETLIRGDVREALSSVILVSNGDDIFLSSHTQDPIKKMQDMTDNEAIGAIHARDAVRKQMGLQSIQHILVTNPERSIGIGVVRETGESHKPKTVGELVSKLRNVHLIDPDMLVLKEILQIASKQNLPLELVTNAERKIDYGPNLRGLIERSGFQVRLAFPEDGRKALSLIYGSTDEDTIAQITGYGEDFSQEGDLIAIINDSSKLNRLPEGTKYVCVGSLVAQAVYEKFHELASKGKLGVAQIDHGKGAL